MSNVKYMTKYQLEHLKRRVASEVDPIIHQAKLMRKSIVADLTEEAEVKLAKKIKADVVIDELQKSIEQLEIAQRKAYTFFSKGATTVTLKDNLSSSFSNKKEATLTESSYGDKGILPKDCREQLRSWAEVIAIKEAEKTPEGKKVHELELYKASAVNQIFETGLPEDLPKTLEAIFKPLGIIWNKTEALQLENKG